MRFLRYLPVLFTLGLLGSLALANQSSPAFVFRFNLYALLSLTAFVVGIFLISAISRIKHKTTSTAWFTVFLTAVAVWGLTEFLQRLSTTAEGALVWAKISALGYLSIGPSFLLYALSYGREDRLGIGLLRLINLLAPLATFLYLDLSTDLISIHDPAQAISRSWGFVEPNGPYFNFFLLWLDALVIYALAILINKYRHSQLEIEKKQLRLVVAGTLIPLVIGTITDGIMVSLGIHILPLGVFTIAIMGTFITYANIRYSLFIFDPSAFSNYVLNTMREMVIFLNREQKIAYVNQSVQDRLGYQEQELLDTSLKNLLSEHQRITKIAETGVQVQPAELTTKASEILPVLVSATKLFSQPGQEVGTAVVMTDISQVAEIGKENVELEKTKQAMLNVLEDEQALRKKLRREKAGVEQKVLERTEELRQARAKDEATLASIGDGLVAIDSKGRIALVNNAFEKILGWKKSEVQGKIVSDVIPIVDENGRRVPESKRLITKTLKERLAGTASTAGYYKRRNGGAFPVALTASPILAGNTILGAVEVFRDITKEREIDRAKTEFVSLASHQLRTPLSTINWYTEMILAGDAGVITEKQQRYLEEIYRGNQRMVELVNALLNVSRIELGTFSVAPEIINLAALARVAIDEQKPQIKERRLRLIPEFEEKIPKINADPNLIQIIFQNLLSNAVKYTPDKGTVRFAVSLDTAKKNILITVTDTGYGIPKHQQDRVFKKLFRADNVRERDTEGTGLGLYIVKSIVEHSGGKIWFKSEENKGTTFWVTLPLEGMKKKEGTKPLA